MHSPKTHPWGLSNRGLTLVELMIVVAIVGVLAALGSVAFNRYIKAGKIEKMKSIALQVAQGQEDFGRKAKQFVNPNAAFAPGDPEWQLLGYNQQQLGPILLAASAGLRGTACFDPPGGFVNSPCGSVTVDTNNRNWYLIALEQDLDGDPAANTMVIVTSDMLSSQIEPIVLFEGQ